MKKENENLKVTLEDTPINKLNKLMDKLIIGLLLATIVTIVIVKLIVG